MTEPVTTGQIYWGAVPFVVIQCIMVGLVIGFPQMVMHYKGHGPVVDPSKIEIELPSFGGPPGLPGGLFNLPPPPSAPTAPPPGLGAPPSDLMPPASTSVPTCLHRACRRCRPISMPPPQRRRRHRHARDSATGCQSSRPPQLRSHLPSASAPAEPAIVPPALPPGLISPSQELASPATGRIDAPLRLLAL